jgi:hypothetical protein
MRISSIFLLSLVIFQGVSVNGYCQLTKNTTKKKARSSVSIKNTASLNSGLRTTIERLKKTLQAKDVDLFFATGSSTDAKRILISPKNKRIIVNQLRTLLLESRKLTNNGFAMGPPYGPYRLVITSRTHGEETVLCPVGDRNLRLNSKRPWSAQFTDKSGRFDPNVIDFYANFELFDLILILLPPTQVKQYRSPPPKRNKKN